MFLLWYGIFRFCIEFARSPDPQLRLIGLGFLSMGQILSLPMILLGLIMLCLAHAGGRRRMSLFHMPGLRTSNDSRDQHLEPYLRPS